MQVTVRLYAGLSQLAGWPRAAIDVPEPATVADVLRRLGELHPGLAPHLEGVVAVVGGRHAGPGDPVPPGEEVALVRPMAGGSQQIAQSGARSGSERRLSHGRP